MKLIKGYEDVFIHADKHGFSYKNEKGDEIGYYSPREFAEILNDDPSYKGGKIRLFACSSAAEGATAAQALSNQLGVEILAPSNEVFVDTEGNIIIGTFEDAVKGISTGKWVHIKPQGKV